MINIPILTAATNGQPQKAWKVVADEIRAIHPRKPGPMNKPRGTLRS
jgi:hypothetical protein